MLGQAALPSKAKKRCCLLPKQKATLIENTCTYTMANPARYYTMKMTEILTRKIHHTDYAELIGRAYDQFSLAEQTLLLQILTRFDFDPTQEQALALAVLQQQRFDPMAMHMDVDDEDTTSVCLHCLNPPAPPLRDYEQWRSQQQN